MFVIYWFIDLLIRDQNLLMLTYMLEITELPSCRVISNVNLKWKGNLFSGFPKQHIDYVFTKGKHNDFEKSK